MLVSVFHEYIVPSQHTSLLFCFYLWNFTYVVVFVVANGNGKLGERTYIEKHLPTFPTLGARQEAFRVYFDYDANFGIPGAFYIKNYTQDEFFFVSLTLEDIPNHGTIHFDCNSWVYNAKLYKRDRIFFTNDVSYVPSYYLFNNYNNINNV